MRSEKKVLVPNLYDRSVGLWVACRNAIDGLAGLALVVDGSLRLCRGGVLLGLHRDRLLGVGVPERGVTLLTLDLWAGCLRRLRQDAQIRVLCWHSRLDKL